MSNSRQMPYFYHTETKESCWETPTGLTKEQVEQLPGAQFLRPASQAKSPQGGGKPGQVRASHLLVKHNASRRPSSWKEVRLHLYFLERHPYTINRPTSHARKMKLLPYSVDMKKKLEAVQRNSRNLPRSIQIVLLIRRGVIWDGLDLDKCKNRLRKGHLLLMSGRSVKLSPRIVVCI